MYRLSWPGKAISLSGEIKHADVGDGQLTLALFLVK